MGRGSCHPDHHPVRERVVQCPGRLSQQTGPIHLYRVDASSGHLQSTMKTLELCHSGPVCHEAQLQTSKLCLAVSGSNGNSHRCLPVQLGYQDLYAFPPFPLIRKVINKLRAASCTNLILIAPFWPQKEWLPDLVQASVDSPRLLPRFHQVLPMLQLAAWRLSSESSVTEGIPPELRNSWRVLNRHRRSL
ncbi:hypothetical protein Pcinc_015550 [Petrolisthes cinctipes]|uniref:Uncharacterized protein n=1 Tax=Petrolisthes cinctipes TaxID=88211 RepID=A0AAE1KN00_PETCI|nr:hypothetical protein Pcinc_015550 [Petrolisthes cinctipes]